MSKLLTTDCIQLVLLYLCSLPLNMEAEPGESNKPVGCNIEKHICLMSRQTVIRVTIFKVFSCVNLSD